MKRKLILWVLLAGGLLAMTACSTFSKKGDPSAMQDGPDNVDVAYIQRINAQANARGDVVIWVNPPKKDVAAASH